METFALIGFVVALALACALALQAAYMVFIENARRQLAKRYRRLEAENLSLRTQLQRTEVELARLRAAQEEVWPEIVGDDTTEI